jgi:hypothetical protein
MGILGSFQLDSWMLVLVMSLLVCVCGSVCAESAERAERGFRLVTSQINKHPKKIFTFKLRFCVSNCTRKVAFFFLKGRGGHPVSI